MLYEFNQVKNATKAAKAICSVYGENSLSVSTCQIWFALFRVEDKERPGAPQKLKTDKLEVLLEEKPRQSARELANKLQVDQSTVIRRLHAKWKINKVGKWVPHKLWEININQRLNTCISLLAKYKKKDYLWKIVTGDEKWIYFNNPTNKKHWLSPGQSPIPTPKPNIYRQKTMLWGDLKGILYYELLNPKQTV